MRKRFSAECRRSLDSESTESSSVFALDSCYELLKENVLIFKEKGRVILLGDFNAGKSIEMDDVIGMFGEDVCNASGNRLVSFLNEVEMVVCNGRTFVSEPEWTRVKPSLASHTNFLM